MRKLIFIVLACIIALFCAGCGSYTPPIILSPDENQTSPNPPEGDEGEDEGLVYTVSLRQENGRSYIPPVPIYAQWMNVDEDNNSVFTSQFNAAGIARATGLEGDYRVTLSNLPDGYAYDPNNGGAQYIATEDTPNISITIFRLKELSGVGDNLYMNCLSFSESGMYRITLNSKSQRLYFEFTPRTTGIYSVESCADISANEINPKLQPYTGTTQYKHPDPEVDGGGSSSSYTKNFKFERMIGNYEEGSPICFAVWAESNRGYPVTVDLMVVYAGDVPPVEFVKSVGPYYSGAKPSGNFHYMYENSPGGLLDASKVKLDWTDLNEDGVWQEGEGDGFYHVYDQTLYQSTNGFGPLVFMKISQPCELFEHMQTGTASPSIIQNLNMVFGDYNYVGFFDSYQSYIKFDGVHPVNVELQTFLQRLALYYRMFLDGIGNVESITGLSGNGASGLSSDEESQWLFACGVYR